MTKNALFGGHSFAAFLFDLDGTLLTSIEAAERIWAAWARRHGIDVATFLPTIHGVRAVDTVRRARPDLDAEAEAAAVTRAEIEDVAGVRAIVGAEAFVAALPKRCWAISTSAPRALAVRRLEAAHLPMPDVLVAAEDVTRGKPEPDGFRLAARKLGVAPEDCLVFEDAPAGIEAAERAGASVLVIRATHIHPLPTMHPGIDDYHGIDVRTGAGGRLTLWA